MKFKSGPPDASTPDRDRFFLLSHNYWGTTSRTIIDASIIDFNDNFNLPRIVYEPILETPSETTYPFVVDVKVGTAELINAQEVGPGEVIFTVTFNRNMDPGVQPQVSFGPAEPWTDFRVRPLEGSGWTDARTWKGSARITPLTGDGRQSIRVAGAVAADDAWLVTGDDSERFAFEVSTTGVNAMNLQSTGGEGRVELSWFQDDFELMAGYNLYRSSTPTGTFTRMNATLIPREQKEFVDTDVQPGQAYYYHFTVVKTDFAESNPSNTASATPLDTIPPVVSHTPLREAMPNLSLTIRADVTDNVGVSGVKLFFRKTGTSTYTQRTMVKTTGARYSATLLASEVVAPGVDYYIEASDGLSTTRSGRSEAPHVIEVVDRPVITAISPNNGPSTGGTAVTIAGSNFKPGARVHFGTLEGTGVVVQSANQLTCVAPPYFPTAVDVTVTNSDGGAGTSLKGFRYESNAVELGLPILTGGRNSFVEAPLLIANAVGLASVDVVVTYDAAVLRLVTVKPGGLTPNWVVASNTTTAGEVILSMASGGGTAAGSGALAILEFQAIGEPSATTPLTLQSFSLNDGAIAVQERNGSFTIDATYALSGTVRFWNGGQAAPGVKLSLSGGANQSQTTDGLGAYALQNIEAGAYTVTASKMGDSSGISAFDASLILKHSAGIALLTGSATVAADVNRSGQINAMDAYLVLQKAVGLIDVPFSGAGETWSFTPASRSYPNFAENLANQDFTAILLGDASGNWNSTEINNTNSSGGTVVLHEMPVDGTDEIVARVLMTSSEPMIEGLDLVLAHRPEVTLESVVPGSLLTGFFDALNTATPGRPRVVVAGSSGIRGTGVLFTLRFRGSGPTGLAISSYSANEGRYSITSSAEIAPFDTDGDGLIDADEVELFQTDPAAADSTGDGISDGLAHQLGLDPKDPQSLFRMSMAKPAAASIRLSWPSRAGNLYQIEASANLGDWQALGEPIQATGNETEVVLPMDGAVNRFYRAGFLEGGVSK
ncbi:MAG: IPT/TIG domain-containing protein [Akkermansiaceae bacterium]